jgi:acetoacetate decarboxylase
MAAPKRVTGLAFALAFVLAGSGSAAAEERPAPGAGFFDAAPLDDPAFGRCAWMTRTGPFVFQESDYIRGYFEPTNLAAYQQALPRPFGMPARPLIRIAFLDFYDMAQGPTYLETEVAILGMDGTQPGWVVLTLPVTNGPACIGGRDLFGLAKVMRRISLVRAADRYTGTLYTRGAEKVDFTLTVDIGEPGTAGRELLRQYGVYPQFGLLKGKVLRFGGSGTSLSELAARGDFQIKLGTARLDVSPDPNSLANRLGIGAPLVGHWSRIRVKYSIKPL